MAQFCIACGAGLASDAAFCESCGKPVGDVPAVTPRAGPSGGLRPHQARALLIIGGLGAAAAVAYAIVSSGTLGGDRLNNARAAKLIKDYAKENCEQTELFRIENGDPSLVSRAVGGLILQEETDVKLTQVGKEENYPSFMGRSYPQVSYKYKYAIDGQQIEAAYSVISSMFGTTHKLESCAFLPDKVSVLDVSIQGEDRDAADILFNVTLVDTPLLRALRDGQSTVYGAGLQLSDAVQPLPSTTEFVAHLKKLDSTGWRVEAIKLKNSEREDLGMN